MTSNGTSTRPAIDDRIAERRREVRRERRVARRRRTLAVLVLLVVAAGLVAVERSPLVGLEEVEVAGTERLDPQEVRDAAALELGTSTLRLRLNAAEARVAALPLVGDVEASRVDPLTVRIAVTEREPVLNVTGEGGPAQVDRTGVVLEEGARDGLPVVTVPGPVPTPGQRGDDDGPLQGAVRAWRGLSGPLRAEVTAIRADDRAALTLDLRSGVEVRFGRAARLDEKVRAIGAVLEDVGDTDVTAVDVRAPTRPVVVP